jgi:hypothetical protein
MEGYSYAPKRKAEVSTEMNKVSVLYEIKNQVGSSRPKDGSCL